MAASLTSYLSLLPSSVVQLLLLQFCQELLVHPSVLLVLLPDFLFVGKDASILKDERMRKIITIIFKKISFFFLNLFSSEVISRDCLFKINVKSTALFSCNSLNNLWTKAIQRKQTKKQTSKKLDPVYLGHF